MLCSFTDGVKKHFPDEDSVGKVCIFEEVCVFFWWYSASCLLHGADDHLTGADHEVEDTFLSGKARVDLGGFCTMFAHFGGAFRKIHNYAYISYIYICLE